jgi:hypothetical protein
VEEAAVKRVADPTRFWTLTCLWVGAILSSAPPVVQASPPEYLGHRGPWVEAPEHANAPIDDLGRPTIRREPGATAWSWLTDAEPKVQIRSYYLERDRDGEADSLAWALGGAVEYRSGLWRDRVGLGATFYSASSIPPRQRPASATPYRRSLTASAPAGITPPAVNFATL